MDSSVILIVNPVSGAFSEKKLNASIELLKKRYKDVKIYYTGKRGDAEVFARNAARESPEMIMVVGGDGTFTEAVNGLAFTDIPTAFIPSGTANVLALELSIPQDIYQATLKAINGKPEYINIGSINDKYFVLMVGVGFDGETVYRLIHRTKHLLGKLAYIISGLRVFISYYPKKLKINIDGKDYEGYGIIICNSKYYGGSFVICPGASLNTLKLFSFIMHGRRRIDLLGYLIGILIGKQVCLKNITIVEGQEITILGDAYVQTDGDYFGTTPAKIKIHKKALKIII